MIFYGNGESHLDLLCLWGFENHEPRIFTGYDYGDNKCVRRHYVFTPSF